MREAGSKMETSSRKGSIWSTLRRGFTGLLLTLVFLVNGYQATGYLRLIAFGETASGTVVDKQSHSGNGTTKYRLGYSFQLGDQSYNGSALLSRSDYDKLVSKGPLSVAYLPNSPEVNDYKDHLWSSLFYRLIAMAVCGLVLLIGFAITYLSSRVARQAKASAQA